MLEKTKEIEKSKKYNKDFEKNFVNHYGLYNLNKKHNLIDVPIKPKYYWNYDLSIKKFNGVVYVHNSM